MVSFIKRGPVSKLRISMYVIVFATPIKNFIRTKYFTDTEEFPLKPGPHFIQKLLWW